MSDYNDDVQTDIDQADMGEDEAAASTNRGIRLRDQLGLLTQADLADLLGVKPNTLYQWRRKALGPNYITLGTRVAYRLRDVAEWVNTLPSEVPTIILPGEAKGRGRPRKDHQSAPETAETVQKVAEPVPVLEPVETPTEPLGEPIDAMFEDVQPIPMTKVSEPVQHEPEVITGAGADDPPAGAAVVDHPADPELDDLVATLLAEDPNEIVFEDDEDDQ